MAIYTRTGDNKTTSLFGGKRLLKSDIRIEAYGSLDELSTCIGLLISLKLENREKKKMIQIQKDLYLIMGNLSGSKMNLKSLHTQVSLFEKEIDTIEKTLPPIHGFIFPNGSSKTVYTHLCRTVCRRAERAVIKYITSSKSHIASSEYILPYLNRLSDYLYMKARQYNQGREKIIKL